MLSRHGKPLALRDELALSLGAANALNLLKRRSFSLFQSKSGNGESAALMVRHMLHYNVTFSAQTLHHRVGRKRTRSIGAH